MNKVFFDNIDEKLEKTFVILKKLYVLVLIHLKCSCYVHFYVLYETNEFVRNLFSYTVMVQLYSLL